MCCATVHCYIVDCILISNDYCVIFTPGLDKTLQQKRQRRSFQGSIAKQYKCHIYLCIVKALHVQGKNLPKRQRKDLVWFSVDFDALEYCDTHAWSVLDANGEKATAPCLCFHTMTQVSHKPSILFEKLLIQLVSSYICAERTHGLQLISFYGYASN